ncbi:MAG: sigma-E processing peptidase SpoIIGA [Bacilli bacterium]
MKIYLDVVFFLNFSFDFLLLLTVSLVLKRPVKIRRLILGASIGAISIIFLFWPLTSITLFLLKAVISVFMILGTYGFKEIKYFIKNIVYLYFVSILLGGFLYFLNIQFSYKNEGLIFFFQGLSINVVFLIVVSPLILYFYIKEVKKLKLTNITYHKLDIYLPNNEIITFNGYLDTGNQLYDPYKHRPIILIYSKQINIPYEKALLVPYEALNHQGVICCLIVPKVVINGSKTIYNVLIGKSNEPFSIPGVDAIIHPDFLL